MRNWWMGLGMMVAAMAGVACHKAAEPPPAGLTLMGNAVRGGMNSQIAEWYEAVLPEVEKELGFPIQYLSAGVPDQDFKARAALDIRSGKGADVLNLDQFWIPEFADAGFLAPLDSYVAGWPDYAQFYDGVKGMGEYRGHVYTVVWNADVRMLFYHREIFEQAGIELPWRPQSWEDIVAAAKKIKAARPEVTPLQINAGVEMGEAATMQGFSMVYLGAGGKLFDPSDRKWITAGPPYQKTAEFFRRIYQLEKLADAQLQLSPKGRDKSFERFSKGEIAIYLEGTWFYSSVLDPAGPWGIADRDQKIGWAPMPGSGEAGAPAMVSISGGDGLVINPNCRDKDRAWKLIAALNRLDRQARLFQIKPITPTRRDLAELPEVKANAFISETAQTLMPVTTSRPGLPEYQEVSFQIQLLTERIISGQMTPEEALADYARGVAQAVGEERTKGATP